MSVVKFHIKPTVLLLPSRFDETIDKSLNPDPKGAQSNLLLQIYLCICLLLTALPDEFATPYHVAIRPTAEFSYDAARNKLISIRIGESNGPSITIQTPGDMHDISGELRRRGNLLRLAGWINVESKVTVGCAGAVLTYLQRKASIDGGPGEGDGGGVLVAEIEMWSMADVMYVPSWECVQ